MEKKSVNRMQKTVCHMTRPDNMYTNMNNCANPEAQAYLAGFHQILECEYNNMVAEFFNGFERAPKIKLASDLDLSVACDQNHIFFQIDEENTLDNDDVSVEVIQGKDLDGRYSIALFRGVMRFEPDTFHFSKAIGMDGRITLAFKATRGAETVYWGDLAGLYP